jgi:hypothetical protein
MIGKTIVVAALAIIAAGCAANKPDTVVVSGNGKCHPSQALPPAIVIETIPAKPTDKDGLYDLLVDSRKALGTAADQYRKLWDECVGKGVIDAGGDHVGGK